MIGPSVPSCSTCHFDRIIQVGKKSPVVSLGNPNQYVLNGSSRWNYPSPLFKICCPCWFLHLLLRTLRIMKTFERMSSEIFRNKLVYLVPLQCLWNYVLSSRTVATQKPSAISVLLSDFRGNGAFNSSFCIFPCWHKQEDIFYYKKGKKSSEPLDPCLVMAVSVDWSISSPLLELWTLSELVSAWCCAAYLSGQANSAPGK